MKKTLNYEENRVWVIIGEDGNPLFVASDVAKILGYNEPHKAVSRHCKHGTKHPVFDNQGVEHYYWVIPESDVYRLVFRSKMPRAEKFEEWVAGDLLLSIRKPGMNQHTLT